MITELRQILSPKNRLLSHLLFWISYLLFFTVMYTSIDERYDKALIYMGSTLPVRITATYFTLYWLIPQFIFRKKYGAFAAWFILSAVVFGYLDRLVLHIYYTPRYFPHYDYTIYPLWHIGKMFQHVVGVYTVVFAAAAIKLIKRNYQNEKVAEALAKDKLDAELKFLKGQIHPHFLFNTLNNLYALTLQNSPKSSEVVLKLSNLLDYMLYECNVSSVPLSKEIKQIHNFIGLEKLRYGDRLEVVFTFSGDVTNQQVPPLLMLPFVENAFKHGVSNDMEASFISIDIGVKGNRLTLKVENSKASDGIPADEQYTKGIGLKNVKRRLDLLFGEHYDLQIFDEEETFLIVLRIELDQAIQEELPVSSAALLPIAFSAKKDVILPLPPTVRP